MFSKSKRIIGVALAALMVASSFAGCGDNGGSSSTGRTGSTASNASQAAVEPLTVDQIMADPQLALGDEGKDSQVTLKVWAPNEAIDVFREQCDKFAKSFPDRKVKIELVPQSESEAATALMNDPQEAADVFGFASDQASKLFPEGYVGKVRAQFAQPLRDENLEDCINAASYQRKDDKELSMYAYPETGDNGYVFYYNKSMITEEQMGSMESIMEVCKAKDKNMILNLGDGFYGCIVPLTGGGTYSVGENNNQLLHYDYEKIGPVARAFSDLLAKDKHYINEDPNKILASALKNESALGGVVGPWKSKAIKNALGDNYGVTKLPTIKVDGKDTQIVSMFGYKLMGVNANTKFPLTAHSLAYYLSSEKCQTERMEKLGWGPSIKKLIESDAVKKDETLNAIYAQQEFSVPQTGLVGAFWDPTAGFGKYIIDSTNDLSDAGIKKAYDNMVENITAS